MTLPKAKNQITSIEPVSATSAKDPATMGSREYWSGVAGNIGPSAVQNLAGTAHALNPANWSETASALGNVGYGAYSKAKGALGYPTNPKDQAAFNALIQPFSSKDEFYRTLYNDPFTVLTAASIPFTAGASALGAGAEVLGAASTVGRAANLTSKALRAVSYATDPTKAVVGTVKGIGNLGSNVAKGFVSAESGVPVSTYETAYDVGKGVAPAGYTAEDVKNVFNGYAKGEPGLLPVSDPQWAGHPLHPYAVAGSQLSDTLAHGGFSQVLAGSGAATALASAGYHLATGQPVMAAAHLIPLAGQAAIQSPKTMGKAAYIMGQVAGSPVGTAADVAGKTAQTATQVASPFEQAMSNAAEQQKQSQPASAQPKPMNSIDTIEPVVDDSSPAPRASGGRTIDSVSLKAQALINMVDSIKKEQSKETEPLLNLDDNTVAKALAVANRHI